MISFGNPISCIARFLQRVVLLFGTAGLIFVIGLDIEPIRVAHATQTPAQISARITALSGLQPGEIDQIYAAEQSANILIIASEVSIPIMLEDRIGYLLLRVQATGQWVRMIVPLSEWDADFKPYLDAQGVTVNRQKYGTIDSTTPADEAAAIAAAGSIPGAAIANLVLHGSVDGPAGTVPAAPGPAPKSVPALASLAGVDSVGTTAGNFRVSESGAATYSVPIATAAGTAGVAPRISLNYSSQVGNGPLGQGWSVGGLSSISRCRQTYDQDRNVTAIDFSANDRFCLDGQRLVKTSTGTYGALNTTYRTEIDNGAIVTIAAVSSGEPDFFEVKRQDGSTSHYGRAGTSDTNEAKLSPATGDTLTWSIRKFSDSVGNPIWFEYDTSTSHQRISEIRWAFGSATGPSGYNARVVFTYETRSDTQRSYVDGYPLTDNQRLSEITSYATSGSAQLRRYELLYDENITVSDSLSRLTSIQECVGTTCLQNKLKFNWRVTDGLAPYEPNSYWYFSLGGTLRGYQPADINGDGQIDLAWVIGTGSTATLKYALHEGNQFVVKTFAGGSTGLSVDIGGGGASIRSLDYNLDGRQDIAYYDTTALEWRIVLSEPISSGNWQLSNSKVDSGISERAITFVDVDSNGTTDALYQEDNPFDTRLYVRKLEVDTSAAVSSSTYYKFGSAQLVAGTGGTTTGGAIAAIAPDFNNDGRVDVVIGGEFEICDPSDVDDCTDHDNDGSLFTLSGVESGTPTASLYYSIPTSSVTVGGVTETHSARINELQVVDANTDGLSDIFYPVSLTPISDRSRFELRINKGDGTFESPQIFTVASMLDDDSDVNLVDWNLDGHPDLMWRDDSGTGVLKVRYWQPLTNAFGSSETLTSQVSNNSNEGVLFADITGDGAQDIVRMNRDGVIGDGQVLSRVVNGSNSLHAMNTIEEIENGIGAVTGISYAALGRYSGYERLQVSSTQVPGEFCENEGIPGEEFCYDAPQTVADKAAFYTALNSGWGYPTDWQSIASSSPVLEFSAPIPVVTQVTGDAPAAGSLPGNVDTSGTSAIGYRYAGGRIQAAGRGFLGFERLTTIDFQTTDIQTTSSVETVTRYRQDWPFTGRPIGTEVVSQHGHTLSKSTNEWEILEWQSSTPTDIESNGTAYVGPLHVVQTRSTDKSYDLASNGGAQGTLLSDIVTETTYESGSEGFPKTVTVITSDVDSELKRVVTTNVYDTVNFPANEGRLEQAVVASTYGGSTSTLTTNFTYHLVGAVRGLLETEELDPGSGGPAAITTTHSYDGFGNLVRSAVEAGGTTRCNVDTSDYDSIGRYVDETFDCLGRKTSTVVARNDFGSPTQIRSYVDVSAQTFVTAETEYSALGRKYYQYSSSGASSTEYLSNDLANCPAGTAYKTISRANDGSETQVCNDVLGRQTRTLTKGFDGLWDVQDVEYDEFGRVAHQSEPYDLGSSTVYWTKISYDLLGRPTSTVLPDDSTSSVTYAYASTASTYAPSRAALRTTTTNDFGQVRHEFTNAAGEAILAIANDGGRTSFTYDELGNLTSTTDAGGNTSSMTYDVLGRKETMSDPDKGDWSYDYNAFGELIKQTDARTQVQVMAYDDLGRMTCRLDDASGGNPSCSSPPSGLEGAAFWVYDTAANGLGQVSSVTDSTSNYSQAFAYDSLGRLSTVDTTIDGSTYSEKTTYDELGRVFQVFDAAGDGTFDDQGVMHNYNASGYLYLVGDAVEVSGAPRTVYREIKSMNARGQVVEEDLGDNVVGTTNTYFAETGRLNKIASTATATGYDVQDLTYGWDDLGNLLFRDEKSGSKNLSESFSYTDGMNRLNRYTVTGQAPIDVSYTLDGNIVNKSDVGTADYNYGTGSPNPHPHAVKAADGVTYTYDANGNNLTGDGRTIAYTVFDKPSSIQTSTHTVEFEYGPSRSRYKRTDTETGSSPTVTRYVGNVELIDRSDGTHERKRYIAGIAIETIHFGTNSIEDYRETHYQFKDHLGSLDVIANSSGEVVQEMSFDPWGQRRDAVDWTSLTSVELTNFDHAITTRGFTGHEMLDEVGIVHMNGRIYDPKLGRFLQADPFVQDPTNTQSLNRYSYVLNNPLNATDPSGYFVASLFLGAALKAAGIKSLGTWAFVMGVGGMADALSAGATLDDALLSGISSAAFAAVGGQFAEGGMFADSNWLTGAIVFGALGGITSVMQGGKFGDGFRSAGLAATAGAAAGKVLPGIKSDSARWVARVIAAGTTSEIAGGKFSSGAVSALFGIIVEDALIPSPIGSDTAPDLTRFDEELAKLTPEEREANFRRNLDVFRKAFSAIEAEGDYKIPTEIVPVDISDSRVRGSLASVKCNLFTNCGSKVYVANQYLQVPQLPTELLITAYHETLHFNDSRWNNWLVGKGLAEDYHTQIELRARQFNVIWEGSDPEIKSISSRFYQLVDESND